MKLYKIIPVAAIVLAGLVYGCSKSMDSSYAPASSLSNASVLSSEMTSAALKGGKLPSLAAVNLGVAGNFVILSTSGITDVSASAITGDIGTSPINGAAILVPCAEVTGTIYSVDATGPACEVINPTRLTAAVGDMGTAYTDAAGRSTSLPNAKYLNLGAGTIGASTPSLAPGVYTWNSALDITGNITLKGGPNDVFIFQVNGTLDMASAASIILTGGAQAKNIFWQVTGAVTLGTTSHFEGNILTAPDSYIAMNTGASINGRLLAGTAVTLQSNAVTQPSVTQPPVTKGKK